MRRTTSVLSLGLAVLFAGLSATSADAVAEELSDHGVRESRFELIHPQIDKRVMLSVDAVKRKLQAPLRSYIFAGDAQLNAALVRDNAHVVPGAVGDHVLKIQMALEVLDNATIPENEKSSKTYGSDTAAAVLAYKTARGIINPAYQTKPDNVVGKMTIRRMDDELAGGTGSRAEMMTTAHTRSRQSLRAVQTRLQNLQTQIDQIALMPEPLSSNAVAELQVSHARDLQVLSRALLVSADPLDAQFRDALQETLRLIQENLNQPLTIMDGGSTGRCTPTPGKDTFGATTPTDPDPRVSLCDPSFARAADHQRDVVTHEYFHLLGLGDHAVNNTAEGLTNADTMAQIVALLFDRFRQQHSSGSYSWTPPLPSP
jgi:hypothetical protein